MMNNNSFRGIITRGVGGLYGVRIKTNDGYAPEEVLCRARGAFRHEQLTPTVGDDVAVKPLADYNPDEIKQEEDGHDKHKGKAKDVQVDFVIDEILPRRSIMIRPALSNLDYLFAVIPAASPEPDLLTADKLTVIAENYGIETVVVINKADIAPPDSHLLTAWRETPNASLNCSWDSPARLRKAAIFSDNGIKKARPFG